MNLDIRTFAVVGFALETAFVIFLFFIPLRFDLRRVLHSLRLAIFLAMIGFLGFACRDIIPDFWSVWVTNLLFLAAYLCLGRALRRFHQRPQENQFDAALLVGLALFLIPTTFVTPAWQFRSALIALFLFVVYIRNLRALYSVPTIDREQRRLFRLVGFSISLDILYRLFGLIPALIILGDPAPSYTHAGPASQLGLLWALVGVMFINVSFLWLVFDHTARELRHREEFLRTVTERSPALLFTARRQADGTITYPWSSRPLTEVFAFDPNVPPVDGTHSFTTLHPDDRGDARRILAASIRDRTPIRAEWRFNTLAGGYRWTRVEATVLPDTRDGISWVGSFTDIHDLKELSRQLRDSGDQLAEQNRALQELNTLKQRLLSIIAHDLKNPFAVILGITRHLADGTAGASPERWREIGRTVHNAATEAYDLLENLLAWGRAKELPFRPQPLELAAAAAQAVRHCAAAAGRKRIALREEVAPGLTLRADPALLAAILRNLVGNAIKFTPADGAVTISATARGGAVEVAVTDTGRGLAPEEVTRLNAGEAGYSTAGTEHESGTGLGLSVCRELLARHGATLAIANAPGAGSRFSFTLPAES